MVDQVIPPPPIGYSIVDSPSQVSQTSAASAAPPVSVSSDNIPPPPDGYSVVDIGAQAQPEEQGTFGKLVAGPNTMAGAPLGQEKQEEASGVSNVFQGNVSQGLSQILHAETPHVVAGSPIEKLIQRFKPDFHGSLTPEQAQDLHNKDYASLENPVVDAAQFIDKDKHPVLKALTEASQSMTSPSNVATMIATGGLGLVESPKALAVANRLISAGFTANAVGQAYKNLKSFKDAYDKGNANDALYQLTHAVTSGTMAYLAGTHAAGTPALEGAAKPITEPIQQVLENRAAGKTAETANEDLNAANKDFMKAIPPTKTNPYDINDVAVVNNYLEPHHAEVEPIRSVQHVVDALDHSVEGAENKVSELVKIIPNEPIKTNVLNDVRSALEKNERGEEFVNSGMKEIEGLNLQKVDMTRADALRRQLNMENKAILKKNNYDLAAARTADPGFAAREAAAASLRKGMYGQFIAHGIEGAEELRQEEGSLLRVRDAAQAQIFNGDKTIKGSGGGSLARRLAGRGVQAASTAAGAGTGAAVGGVTGAVVGGALGAGLGEEVRQHIVPPDLTRDEMLERRFKDKQVATGEPGGVTVNLHAPAEAETPVGTQQTIPPPIPPATSGVPEQPSLFGQITTSASQQSPMVERQLLQQKIRPLQAILESPTTTTTEKIEAARQMAKLGLGQFANPEVPESGMTPAEKAEAAKASLNPTKATGESAQGSDLDLESRYRVPTDPALEIPANMRNPGELSRDTHIAEWGHVTNGALEGFETKGIKSHLHPTLKGTNANAAAGFKTGIDFKDPEAVQRNSGRLLSTIMGHAAAQELHSGIPVEMNPSIDGDIDRLQKLGEILGLSDEEIEGAARYGLDRAKRNLTEPGIGDKLLENVDKREPGLDPTMHASPERTEAYGEEVRRIRDENRQSTGAGVRGNNAGDAGRAVETGKTVEPEAKGDVARGNSEGNIKAKQDLELPSRIANGPVPEPVKIGNIDVNHRLIHWGPSGNPSTIYSATIPVDKKGNSWKGSYKSAPAYALVPTLANGKFLIPGDTGDPKKGQDPNKFYGVDGKETSLEDAAVKQYEKTREHLGIFKSAEDADKYAEATHAWMPNGSNEKVYKPSYQGESNMPLTRKEYEQELAERNKNKISENNTDAVIKESADKAVNSAKKSGGGFVADMRTGKPTDTGYLVEMMPEKRQTLDHDVTPKDIQKFYNDNRQLFRQHPELRIGGYKNELNISAHTDDQPTAERLAKKLDQRSVWDVKAGKEIPTGGKGETKEFKDYPFDKRIKELRGKGKE